MSAARLEGALRARRPLILLLLVLVSAVLRVSYALDLWSSPVLLAHRFAESDMHFFDRWAREIARGDCLTNQELHPMTGWQREAARYYLRQYPEEAAALEKAGVPKGDEDALLRALWSRWYGGKRFHQEPLYAYLVAATYRLLGPDPRWVFLWQLLLGVVTNVLVYLAARRAFGDIAGAAAGLLAVLYAPLLSHEMVLLRTTLAACAVIAAALLIEAAVQDGGTRRWLTAGLSVGIAVLCQLPMLLVAGGVLALLPLAAAKPGRLAAVAAFTAGLALALSPVAVRNVLVGLPPQAFISVGSQTYLPHATAAYDPASGSRGFSADDLRIMHETGGAFLPVVRAAWRTHPTWASRWRLYAGKLAKAWSWYEEADNQSFYYLRLVSPTLARLPVTFALVGPLALAGLLLWPFTRPRRGLPLVLTALTGVAVLVLTIPISRYRAPYLPALLCLAGLTVSRAVTFFLERRWTGLALLVCGIALSALLVLRPLPEGRPLLRTVDWTSPYRYFYGPAANQAANAGRWSEAASLLSEYLEHTPPELPALATKTPLAPGEHDIVCFYGQTFAFHALALERSGRPSDAGPEEARARDLASACERARTR